VIVCTSQEVAIGNRTVLQKRHVSGTVRPKER